MTAIEVNFLTGRYQATAHHARDQHEWPPHPARLFSAMVATWANGDHPDDGERAALEWLEELPPPRITASDADPRKVVSYFVPVNDANIVSAASYQRKSDKLDGLLKDFDGLLSDQDAFLRETDGRPRTAAEERTLRSLTTKIEKLNTRIDKERDVTSLTDGAGRTNPESAVEMLPEGRTKKERHFPSVTPREPRVTFTWPDEVPADKECLDTLLARVTRLGHSASLVSCRLVDDPPAATHLPGDGPDMLRWVQPGQLAALEQSHAQHRQIRPRPLPFRGVNYREAAPEAEHAKRLRPDTAGWWIVFEIEPAQRRLPLTRTVEITETLRRAILSKVDDPIPEGVSGHRADGRPTLQPHAAFIALPNVAHEHADGRLMGLAVSLPDGMDRDARQKVLRAVGEWEQDSSDGPLRLTMGRDGTLNIRRRQGQFALRSIKPSSWSGPSRSWASVTPVALPTHPGGLNRGAPAKRAKAWANAEAAVVKSCEHAGFPAPEHVTVSLSPLVVGSRRPSDFPQFRQGAANGGTLRCLVHAAVEFSEEVSGPFLLGSGRFVGLGLMRPVFNERRASAEGQSKDSSNV